MRNIDRITPQQNTQLATEWGLSIGVDLFNCEKETIRDKDKIESFVKQLVQLIGMRPFGEPVIVHFGSDERVKGYSMTQLIETSLISAHFAEHDNSAYIDVFSCKPFSPQTVKEFAEEFFKSEYAVMHCNLRGKRA